VFLAFLALCRMNNLRVFKESSGFESHPRLQDFLNHDSEGTHYLLAGIELSRGMKAVHLQIQFQNIHVRLAEKSQVAPPGMSLHQRAHVLFVHAA